LKRCTKRTESMRFLWNPLGSRMFRSPHPGCAGATLGFVGNLVRALENLGLPMNQLPTGSHSFARWRGLSENETGHYRSGAMMPRSRAFDEADASFRRTLELARNFPRCIQLLGDCLAKKARRTTHIRVLKSGLRVADERGGKISRGMAKPSSARDSRRRRRRKPHRTGAARTAAAAPKRSR